jgi:hypothetical protein
MFSQQKMASSNAALEERRLQRISSIAYATLLIFAKFIPTIKYLAELISFSSSEPQCFITIIVGEGEEAQTFTLHKDVISRHTQFFDTATKGKFKEGEMQKVYLEDVEPSVFGLFLIWLYSGGTIPQRQIGENKGDILNQTPIQLTKLWVLANRFRMPKLQNAVIDEIFCAIEVVFRDIESLQFTRVTHIVLMWSFIEYAYETNISMLRELAVDRLAFGCSESVFMDMVEFLPNHIVVDVAKALRTGIRMCAEDFYFAED